MPYLDQSKIALPNNETNYNTWADYFEILCLLHPDRSLSVETIKDRLIDENGGDIEKALAQIRGVSRRIDIPLIDMIADDEIDVDINDPEAEQEIKNCIISVIEYMKTRKQIIPHSYPINIHQNYQLSILNAIHPTPENKLYIILLISSLIRIINRKGGFAYRLTHRFEHLCQYPFLQILPQGAKHLFFGAGGYINEIENGNIINGSFYSKVNQIATLLNLQTTKLFTHANAGVYNNGDGGLDWLGYYPFEDGLSTTPTYFAQCACGNDWEDKQFDAHTDKWKNYITWISDYHRIHFIPKSYRDEHNEWLNEISIFNCTLIDRFRLIKLIERSGKVIDIVNLYNDILEEIQATNIDF
jgi:hypothetical protein